MLGENKNNKICFKMTETIGNLIKIFSSVLQTVLIINCHGITKVEK